MTTLPATPPARPHASAPARLAPYRAVDSGKAVHEVMARVNSSNYQCYGSDYRLGADGGKIIVDTLAQYDCFLRCLASRPDIECLPHCELVGRTAPPDRILCGIRHDLDSDVRAALAEAELENRYGIRTTYYILHTGPYYGEFVDGVLRRHGCMAAIYRRIQDLGHEIALHTDALHVYQNLGIDGAEAIRVELEWLREQGLRIVGTVGHNSASVYGAENYSIFKGRTRRVPDEVVTPSPDGPLTEVVHEGKWAPLGILDEAELGLTYEGNDVFWTKTSPLEYGATRFVNRWRWNAHIERLRANPDWTESQFIDQDRLLRELRLMPTGRVLVVNVHPLFYGMRHAEAAAPPLRVDRISTALNDELGWETYVPAAVQAQGGDVGGEVEFQVINHADDLGMLDVPRPSNSDSGSELRVLVLGGTNLDGRCAAVPEHATVQAVDRLRTRLKRPVWIRTLAHPGMGMARLYGWFSRQVGVIRPHIVVLGIGADEPEVSLPQHWSRTTGYDPTHPPGEYLSATDDSVKVIPQSAGALIRRARPRPLPPEQSSSLIRAQTTVQQRKEIAATERCAAFFLAKIRESGGEPLLILQECGESAGLWRREVEQSAREAAHARCLAVLGPMAQRLNARLVDPYALFLQQPDDLPAHWQSHPQWNYTGHRLAGVALMRAIDEMVGGGG